MGPIAWITPFLAGTMQLQYKKFLFYNIPGVIIGIGEFMIIGYFFGYAYNKMLATLGLYSVIIGIIILILFFAYTIWSKRHSTDY